MMNRLSSIQKIWLGAGGIFVSLLLGKQLIWYSIQKQIAKQKVVENEKAQAILNESYENAAKYYVEPLSNDELMLLQKRKMKILLDIETSGENTKL